MPVLGADMEAGTLVEWVRHPGDAVKRGDIIAVVDTQKGAIEIEVFEDGVIEKTVVEPGQEVPVGTVLAVIRPPVRGAGPQEPGAGQPPSISAGRSAGAQTSPAAPAPPMSGPAPPRVAPSEQPARLHVSPIARRVAVDLGVDLAHVVGTGQQGAITRADVERAATSATPDIPAPLATSKVPGDGRAAMRTAIAAAMTRAKREIPHYYLSSTIDLETALAWLRAGNERRPMPDRLLPAALLIKAVARSLRDVPELNGHWIDGGVRPSAGIHVGVAISLRGGGLVAPALHDTDTLDLTTLMRRLRDLVVRARAGSLKSSELSAPTITVTNLGEHGAEAAFGIIYPPQVALVAFGTIAERPWVAAGRVEARPLVTVTLSADHRATDGHRGSVFLAALGRWLQSPEKL